MVVFSFNRKAGKVMIVAAFALILIMLCALISCERRDVVPPYATNDETGEVFTEVSDFDSQRSFLMQFGVAVEPKSLSDDEVTIPESFDSVYDDYNKIQKKAGFDLARFKGREVRRITYKIQNSTESVTLLIYKGHVIGGHISSGNFGDDYLSLCG